MNAQCDVLYLHFMDLALFFPDKLLSGKTFLKHFLMMPCMSVFIFFFFQAIEQDDENADKHVTVTEANDSPDPQVRWLLPERYTFSAEGGYGVTCSQGDRFALCGVLPLIFMAVKSLV